jgi:hypothetical protein
MEEQIRGLAITHTDEESAVSTAELGKKLYFYDDKNLLSVVGVLIQLQLQQQQTVSWSFLQEHVTLDEQTWERLRVIFSSLQWRQGAVDVKQEDYGV